MRKYKRGFTLVELLGVIVIIALIAVIVYPSIKGIIAKQQEKLYNEQVDRYIKVADTYVTDKQDELTYGNDLYITVSDLYKSGYIKSKELTNPIDNSDLSYSCVKATWNSSRNTYEYSFETYCPKHIYDVVLDAFPELELGDSGCKTSDSTKNYTYMGGCYLKGEQTSNYLWYSGFLWRIMGINQDKTVKLITEENTTGIPYNTMNNMNFSGGYVDNWLNEYFYNKLKNNSIIIPEDFCQGVAVSSSPTRNDCTGGITLSRNVGLLSIDEYDLASSSASYLVNSQEFWTMSPYSSSSIWLVFNNGNTFYDNASSTSLRPIIDVDSKSFIVSGNGIMSDIWNDKTSPYILNDNKTTNITGNLKDITMVGEYVKLANKVYRVVSVDSSGNIKLILDGYYQAVTGTNTRIAFGTDNVFSTTSGIGQVLNTTILDWLIPSTDTTNRGKLVTNYSWYQNDFTYYSNYIISLNETNPTRVVQATVGLIRIGEMLSGQSYTILTKNGTVTNNNANADTYWPLTPYKDYSSEIWEIGSDGTTSGLNNVASVSPDTIRPVIVVKSDTQITSGTGTPSSPYQI